MNVLGTELVRLMQWQRDNLPAFVRWFRDCETPSLIDVDVIVPLADEAEQGFY